MPVRVVIYDRVIQAHFTPAGDVGRNAGAVGRTAQAAARAIVSHDTGYLASTIEPGHHPGGRLYYNLFLNANASYAATQEHGHAGTITSNRPNGAMRLRPGRGFSSVVAKRVAGHPGQHYLADGMARALNAHGYPVSATELRRGQGVQRRL